MADQTPPAGAQYIIRNVVLDSPNFKTQQLHDQAGWANHNPKSVLIACIGNHWKPGAWQHVVDMMRFTIDQGIHCELQEIQDRCFDYADALGTMRNEANIVALNRGLEWVLYVENDTFPPKDALVKLLSWWDMARANIVVPFVCESGTGMPLHGPQPGPNTGFHWLKWSVLSFVLFKTSIWQSFGHRFWADAIGADEGFHFQHLAQRGYYLGMDSGLQVPVTRRPQYPLAFNTLVNKISLHEEKIQEVYKRTDLKIPYEEFRKVAVALAELRVGITDRQRHWEDVTMGRMSVPDRRPIDPLDKRVDPSGNYNPFVGAAPPGALQTTVVPVALVPGPEIHADAPAPVPTSTVTLPATEEKS